MALKEPMETSTNSSHSSNLNLPPPQTFDILPPLHELLTRIDAHQNQNRAPTDPSSQSENDYSGDLQPLDPKDLPTAVLEIKTRIRRALRELEKLPDMGRSTAELDEEITELETRIDRQKEVLRRLRIVAGDAAENKLG